MARIVLLCTFIALCSNVFASEYFIELPAKEHARVAPNFTAKEFACHHCEVKKISGDLLYKLELLRKKLGQPIIITSGYRCQTHNKSVGGAKKSQHMNGRAADIQVKGYSPKQVANAAREVGFTFIKTYKTWTHVDVRETQ